MVSSVGMFSIWAATFFTKKSGVLATLIFINGVAAVISSSYFNGGVLGTSIIWIFCAPKLSYTLTKPRLAIILNSASCLALVVFGTLQILQVIVPHTLPIDVQTKSAILNILCLYAFFSIIDSIRVKQDNILKRQILNTNRRLTRLVQLLTHDITNSLTVIKFRHEQMNELKHLVSKHPVFLKAINSQGKHVVSLVQLMDKTRQIALWQQKGSDYEIEAFSLQQSLYTAINNYKDKLDQKDIEVIWNPERIDLEVLGDSLILIHQGLANFISNAIKFSPRGARIWVSGFRELEKFYLAIEDAGPGIPLKTIEAAIADELVVSTSGTDGEEGTGFGLKIAVEMLKDHQMLVSYFNKENNLPKKFEDLIHSPNGTLVVVCFNLAREGQQNQDDVKGVA